MKRLIMYISLAVLVAAFAGSALAGNPEVTFDASAAVPRQVEDSTVAAVIRDYSAAWGQLAQAVEQNRSELLNTGFTGVARDGFLELISSQQKSGLHQRYVDHGHKLKAILYSADGSALEVHDTAQIEFQLMDGDKVVGSQSQTMHYVAALTPAENRWKIRVLQAVNEEAGVK
jgi:hypothetical protein